MDAAFVKTGSKNEELLAVQCDHNDLCYLDTTAEYFKRVCTFVDTSIEDARLRIVKGSPKRKSCNHAVPALWLIF